MPVLFASDSVSGIEVSCAGEKLHLELVSGSKVSIEEYYDMCLEMETHLGFAFSVITAVEDRVGTLSVTWPDMLDRIHIFQPETQVDFSLCVICMYLENIFTEDVTLSNCIMLKAAIDKLKRKITYDMKLAALLANGCEWLLNTLLAIHDLPTFDENLVLPHYGVAKPLMSVECDGLKELVKALYDTHAIMIINFPDSNEREIPVILESRRSSLNRLYENGNFFTRVLRLWWNSPDKRRSAYRLYHKYQ
ncbi:Cytoplasmic envelopment protein 1 [Cacatuid alphaherpesvirus 2]|uniref:Cytoplasmic envelopment protein 1 n=1 Tax=Cacatuid alphaherpesvirus 2 TaxID=2604840 RepID=A0A5B9RBV2_9ALPH|nr:Cytoplasmic envelopment protein 1 [Cacatuid alphaherpesvirus 2]QEG54097.1 Cytoplasmic envelopment protein 1 [Cacatuid alphaherpesvirus 2]